MSFSVRALANSATQIVNPNLLGSISYSTGYTTNPDGTRTPTYNVVQGVTMQVQAATQDTLVQMNNLNIQGVSYEVFVNAKIEGVDRAAGKGGDILTFNGQAYLVVAVLESWDQSGWTRVAVRQQNGM